jgi:hypothetical protein
MPRFVAGLSPPVQAPRLPPLGVTLSRLSDYAAEHDKTRVNISAGRYIRQLKPEEKICQSNGSLASRRN